MCLCLTTKPLSVQVGKSSADKVNVSSDKVGKSLSDGSPDITVFRLKAHVKLPVKTLSETTTNPKPKFETSTPKCDNQPVKVRNVTTFSSNTSDDRDLYGAEDLLLSDAKSVETNEILKSEDSGSSVVGVLMQATFEAEAAQCL